MRVFTIAEYRVRAEGIERVRAAIAEFVSYVRANEPRTLLYEAWQDKAEPTRFTHFFIFVDAAANQAHGKSAAVQRFRDAYTPELVDGPVVFTQYDLVASNRADV